TGYSVREVEEGTEGGKVRRGITGWCHIAEEGEEGYVEGEEERLAEKSSLQQLQGKSEAYDLPQPARRIYDEEEEEASGERGRDVDEERLLTEEDLEFLLKYISPNYLTPDTLERVSGFFVDESCVQLPEILSETFSAKLKAQI